MSPAPAMTNPMGSAVSRDEDAINTVAKSQGMKTLREDGLAKVLQGVTSIEEILRVVV